MKHHLDVPAPAKKKKKKERIEKLNCNDGFNNYDGEITTYMI
jgi:hypothetical protein